MSAAAASSPSVWSLRSRAAAAVWCVVAAACTPRAAPASHREHTETNPAPAVPPPSSPPAVAADGAIASGSSQGSRVGITHEELLRLHGYVDGGADAAPEGEVAPATGEGIAADNEFTDEAPVPAVRARLTIALPDEHLAPGLSTERAFVVTDQGDRAVLQLVGTGLPVVPGMRVLARAGLAGFALVAPDGARYRASAPDELARWFTGAPARAGSNLVFRRTDDTIVATRGGLSVVIATERADGGDAGAPGAAHPLVCRAVVALLLGGDPAAARVGCAAARFPRRVTLRGRGFPAVVLETTAREAVEVPRRALAVPPPGATPELPLPARAPSGAFFAPAELRALGGAREAQHTLTATNALTREALVFVDDLAIGWVAPGQTATFVGLSAGRHVVRARSLDGIERTVPTGTAFPATVRLENPPLLPQR